MIPLIFGNKQTIEFRIHTPTYDINKIMAFIFLNAILVNYTINNQERILNNTLNIGSLENIMFSYMEQENIEYTYIDKLIKYFKERKKIVEDFNRKSEINFDEERIWCNFDFNFKSLNKGLDLGSTGYRHSFLVEELRKQTDENFKKSSSKPLEYSSTIVGFYKSMLDEYRSSDENFRKSVTLKSKPVKKTISYYDEWATPAMPTISTPQPVEPVNNIPENPLTEVFLTDEEWEIMTEEDQQIEFGEIEQDPGPDTIGSPEGPSGTDSLPW